MPIDNAVNLTAVEELYSRYLNDPNSVDASWKNYFENIDQEKAPAGVVKQFEALPEDLRIYNLIDAYRNYGHLIAKINPIATYEIEEPWQLKIETYGFDRNDLARSFPTSGLLPRETAPLQEIINTLRNIYCDRIGIEYMGLENLEMEKWIQERIEPNQFKVKLNVDQKKMILEQLNRSELFESFLHMKYTAQKRFSLEGGETLIPMLETIVENGSKIGMRDFVIGMAHRGRLNVLSNILRKSHSEIFSEFEEGYIPNSFEGSGDVKYHKGFTSEVPANGQKVKISLAPNPSHLEAVDPVVEGQVYAKQILSNDNKKEAIIPILIHGDAALSGQGVVYETMQFYNVPGYNTGGTIHIVINNQIGFTASPAESRSTLYCTDIARAFDAPVFHVNAEDPEGCVYATNLAIALRQTFHCDVFIDLNCYRKYGHNESDEPAFTQPLEYQLIRKKKPIRELYRDYLIQQGHVEKNIAEALEAEFTKALENALQESKTLSSASVKPKKEESSQDKSLDEISTKVPVDILKKIADSMSSVPEGFSIHPKLLNLVKERLSMVQENGKPLDWGMAELLAYGSLLWDGISVRLSGQDSARGTFSHRHAVWMDQKVEKAYYPLNHLKEGQGKFDVINSTLSENAVLGFEMGYSIAYLQSLVIWEAQFGDFCNGAQVIIDQFITTGEQKWGQKCGVVLFLPHGYEGQGPEHSSGRMERFLSLAAQDNIRIANPTTPAQFFHLLRRQTLNPLKKPLIIFTPKGLLRHPACTSQLQDLTSGKFKEIIPDIKSDKASRLILCSGRIYYDIVAEQAKQNNTDTAILRIEQLYPLPLEKIKDELKKLPNLNEWIWAQEEPQNMGAWEFMHHHLKKLLPLELRYVGRNRSASPAAGSYALHKAQHAEIMNALFKR